MSSQFYLLLCHSAENHPAMASLEFPRFFECFSSLKSWFLLFRAYFSSSISQFCCQDEHFYSTHTQFSNAHVNDARLLQMSVFFE